MKKGRFLAFFLILISFCDAAGNKGFRSPSGAKRSTGITPLISRTRLDEPGSAADHADKKPRVIRSLFQTMADSPKKRKIHDDDSSTDGEWSDTESVAKSPPKRSRNKSSHYELDFFATVNEDKIEDALSESPYFSRRSCEILNDVIHDPEIQNRIVKSFESDTDLYEREELKYNSISSNSETSDLIKKAYKINGKFHVINVEHIFCGDNKGGLHYLSPSKNFKYKLLSTNPTNNVRLVEREKIRLEGSSEPSKMLTATLFPEDWTKEYIIEEFKKVLNSNNYISMKIPCGERRGKGQYRSLGAIGNVYIEWISSTKEHDFEEILTVYPIMYYIKDVLPDVFTEEQINAAIKNTDQVLYENGENKILDISEALGSEVSKGVYVELTK